MGKNTRTTLYLLPSLLFLLSDHSQPLPIFHDQGAIATATEATEGFTLAHQYVPPPTIHTPKFLALSRYSARLWHGTNYGEGMIIGVVDSGIIPTHPSFNDDGMPPPPSNWRGRCDFGGKSPCNNKLIGARAFAGGRHLSPLDLSGHGTHCAGVVAGNYVYDADTFGIVAGVAPRAHVAMYKACCPPDHHARDLLAAIEQAISDGVDVLSISLIGKSVASSFHLDPLARGTFAAMANGILAITPAGNRGPLPSSIGNDAPWHLTVGASSTASTDKRIRATVRLGNGMEFDGVSGYQLDNFSSPMLPMVNPADLRTAEAFSCQKGSLDSLDVGGKIVLCGSGFIDSGEMGEVVKAAGGAAMIVMNRPHEELPLKAKLPPCTIPVAHVSFDDARNIQHYFSTIEDPKATILFKHPLPPAVASFSSRGPSLMNGGVLKPDIVGPGVDILGPGKMELCHDDITNSGIFCKKTGTSMATPHLAGVAALLKKSHPQWSPAAIKSAIMTTAYTLNQEGKPITDRASKDSYKPANIFAMGAGHVNPTKADDPGLVYDVQPDDYIPYLCGLGYTDLQASTVVGKEIFCSRYQKITAEELNYPSILVSMEWASNKTVRRTVTNVGEADAVYSVKVDAPKGVKVVVSPHALHFSALNEQKTFSVEFSTAGAMPIWPSEVLQGQLVWVSNKHSVRSPIGVTPQYLLDDELNFF